jgi:hypothetical protein
MYSLPPKIIISQEIPEPCGIKPKTEDRIEGVRMFYWIGSLPYVLPYPIDNKIWHGTGARHRLYPQMEQIYHLEV